MTKETEIRGHVAGFLKRPAAEIDWRSKLADLNIESFLLVEMVVDLQDEFGVRLTHEDLQKVVCLEDLIRLLEERTR